MVRRRILPVGGPEEMPFGTNNLCFCFVRQGPGEPNSSLIVLADDAEAHESQ